ncbi:LysR family transcriptional regulator [Lichenicola sp.]|uniref:LysR family transcriptional regulator n=1 Tax=Lichenicola sp. TaxID=2804529 RepID=UPI003B00BB89
MDLHALADFNLVAGEGGFGRASRTSGRPKATLSRKVMQLERELGVRLVERGSRVLRLTEEGRALYERTTGLLGELAEVGAAVASAAPRPRGRLRVSAPLVFAHVMLGRIGGRFAQAYPEVQLEIVAEDRLADPVEDGYDLVIRINPAPDEQLVGRRFLDDELVLVAPPELPVPAGAPGSAGAVTIPAIMLSTNDFGAVWRIRRPDLTVAFEPRPVLRCSSLLMVRDAVLTGVGASLLPRLLVAGDLANGRLVCWGVQDAPPVGIWALHSSRRLVSAKLRAFLDTLEAEFPDRMIVRSGAQSAASASVTIMS